MLYTLCHVFLCFMPLFSWIYGFYVLFPCYMVKSMSSHAYMLGSMFFHVYVLGFYLFTCTFLCLFAYIYVFTYLYAWIGVLPCFYAHIHMLRCAFTCLHAYVLGSMLSTCFTPSFTCSCAPCHVCHAICYCSPFIALFFFLVFWPIGSDSI